MKGRANDSQRSRWKEDVNLVKVTLRQHRMESAKCCRDESYDQVIMRAFNNSSQMLRKVLFLDWEAPTRRVFRKMPRKPVGSEPVSFVNGDLGGVVGQDPAVLVHHPVQQEVVEVSRGCRWGPNRCPDGRITSSWREQQLCFRDLKISISQMIRTN